MRKGNNFLRSDLVANVPETEVKLKVPLKVNLELSNQKEKNFFREYEEGRDEG